VYRNTGCVLGGGQAGGDESDVRTPAAGEGVCGCVGACMLSCVGVVWRVVYVWAVEGGRTLLHVKISSRSAGCPGTRLFAVHVHVALLACKPAAVVHHPALLLLLLPAQENMRLRAGGDEEDSLLADAVQQLLREKSQLQQEVSRLNRQNEALQVCVGVSVCVGGWGGGSRRLYEREQGPVCRKEGEGGRRAWGAHATHGNRHTCTHNRHTRCGQQS
jgi:hypothetical protein